MQYRIGLVTDYPAITDYVNAKDYFMPVDPTSLGGVWLLAEDGGIVRGTIWFAAGMGNAFVDYWAADTPLAAARLGAYAEEVMKVYGVKHVRGTIGAHHGCAQRLAVGLGMGMTSEHYVMVHKKVA